MIIILFSGTEPMVVRPVRVPSMHPARLGCAVSDLFKDWLTKIGSLQELRMGALIGSGQSFVGLEPSRVYNLEMYSVEMGLLRFVGRVHVSCIAAGHNLLRAASYSVQQSSI